MARVEKVVEATAPTRVDLAGRTLDVRPLHLFHPGAISIGVAIDRRVWCRVEPLADGVHVESKDALVKHQAASVGELLARESSPPLAAYVLRALGIESGVKVATRSRVPADSGLGGSSAVAVTVAAAAAVASGRQLPDQELWALASDCEAQWAGVPVGILDHLTAIHGGLVAVHLEPGAPRVERLPADVAALEECLLLAGSGATGGDGPDGWDVVKRQVDGDAATQRGLSELVAIAAAVESALSAGRLAELPELLSAEWEARKKLGLGVRSPEVERIEAIARQCGGTARVCGAGGGAVVALWAAPGGRGEGPREAVERALKEAKIPAFPFRADLMGLEVEVE